MKKQIFFSLFFVFLIATTTQIQAQDRTVSGTVKDYEGKTLSSVTVTVKGTTFGIPTNGSGTFKIKAGAGVMLTFSKRGFISEELTANSGMNVTMYPNTRKGKRKRRRAMKKKK